VILPNPERKRYIMMNLGPKNRFLDATKDKGIDHKILALAILLELNEDGSDIDEIKEAEGNTLNFEHGDREYLVLTEEEADDRYREGIEDILPYLHVDVLSEATDIDETVFRTLQSCTGDMTSAIRSIIDATCGMDRLIDSALHWDVNSRGTILSLYDGEENEVEIFDTTYLIYRTN
jgi:hypothetical protein